MEGDGWELVVTDDPGLRMFHRRRLPFSMRSTYFLVRLNFLVFVFFLGRLPDTLIVLALHQQLTFTKLVLLTVALTHHTIPYLPTSLTYHRHTFGVDLHEFVL